MLWFSEPCEKGSHVSAESRSRVRYIRRRVLNYDMLRCGFSCEKIE